MMIFRCRWSRPVLIFYYKRIDYALMPILNVDFSLRENAIGRQVDWTIL